MKRPCSLLSLLAVQFLAGCCGPEPLIINGADPSSSGCEAIGETPLSLSGSTPDGDSVGDIVATVSGAHETTLSWSDGSSALLEITVSELSNPRLVDYEVVATGDGASIDIACIDVVSIDAVVEIVSSDGQLNETVVTTVNRPEFHPSPQVFVELDITEGDFDAKEWALEPYDTVSADLTASWVESGLRGTIDGFGETEYGDIATVSLFEIGSFHTDGF